MKRNATILLLTLLVATWLVACADTFEPAPDPPAPTPQPDSVSNLTPPDLAQGQQLYTDKQCRACHGPSAEGGIGPKLAGTANPFPDFLHTVRTALPPKPAFSEADLSTQAVYDIYGWLQNLGPAQAAPAAAPTLPAGEVLGMTLWTEGRCDTCHGAFAQGSPDAPALVNISYPYEMERARMRQTADTIPEHGAEHMRDVILQRLYKWLQAGAKPGDGC
jgi:mono/diheme cytochrome c family protein